MNTESLDALATEARAEAVREMALARGARFCSYCGTAHPSEAGMCAHHTSCLSDDWSKANRIMCDFFHRKIVLPKDTPPVGDYAVAEEWI